MKHKYQKLFWIWLGLAVGVCLILIWLIGSLPHILFSTITFLQVIIIFTSFPLSSAMRTLDRLKKENIVRNPSEFDIQPYADPFKNKIFRKCFLVWIILIVTTGPLYLWFYMTENQQLLRWNGYLFVTLVIVFFVVGFYIQLKQRYFYFKKVDELVELNDNANG